MADSTSPLDVPATKEPLAAGLELHSSADAQPHSKDEDSQNANPSDEINYLGGLRLHSITVA